VREVNGVWEGVKGVRRLAGYEELEGCEEVNGMRGTSTG
jgi:hypothetical protein